MASWYCNATGTLNSNIFNGSDSSVINLYWMIYGGQLLEPDYVTPDTDVLENYALQAMYSVLIPQAWQLSTEAVWPVVVNSTVACDSKSIGPTILEEHLTSKNAAKALICYNNIKYYLLAADTTDGYCSKKKTGHQYRF
ncbi:hypothetical protein BO71DRAFT_488779 [Aspergillus ellipticus CBS 707.79]|uniref:Uncharacterized protein n=1 Tax=Aspergillus ellipticus CBS 707.79 TaxID=1448320 RepID=A0A319CTC5_9EURO|nr:hypothetical protein BO71DRAFT_488779 [Aspergillus ellipticus CBS 707.79]